MRNPTLNQQVQTAGATSLSQKHWLPVIFRIDLILLLVTFKVDVGLASSHIRPRAPARPLGAINAAFLLAPGLNNKGDTTFAVGAPPLHLG